jgi:hypothetical protein
MKKKANDNEWVLPAYKGSLNDLFQVKTLKQLMETPSSSNARFIPKRTLGGKPGMMHLVILTGKDGLTAWEKDNPGSKLDTSRHQVILDYCKRNPQALRKMVEKAKKLGVALWVPAYSHYAYHKMEEEECTMTLLRPRGTVISFTNVEIPESVRGSAKDIEEVVGVILKNKHPGFGGGVRC